MTKKLLQHAALLGFLIFKSGFSFSQTLAAGDIAFTGLNETASTVNGTASNRDFSFILLKNITSGTIIYFTDFGWRSDSPAFQTALPCPSQVAGSGSVSDGVIKWTATSNMNYGTQVVIRCQFAPTCNLGTVTGFQSTYNSTLPNATVQYVTMSVAGESIFAYQGSLASPTLIAGMNTSPTGWAASLLNCDYTPTPSTLPSALSTNNFAFTLTPTSGTQNMQLKPLSIPTTASEARALIATKTNWNMSAGTAFVMPATNPLPVRLVSLNAHTVEDGNVSLTWKVADAVNFSGFQLEKSLDAKTFSLLAEITYQKSVENYAYVDETKISHTGPMYYRLKMKDMDGSFAFSQILTVQKKASDPAKFSAYPNPFVQKIELLTEENEKEKVLVTLTNTNGAQLISRYVAVKNSKLTLEIAEQLSPGIYILSVQTSMGMQKIKMVKDI